MNSQIQETKSLIHKMVPHLNATLKGRSKRALLPFVGNIMGNLFGLVSEDQLKKLVTHINALTKQDNKITTALKHYGGDLTSFITQVENRIDNAMNGIKRNQKALNFLNTLIQRDIVNLEKHYTDYFQLLADQTQDSTTLQNYIIDLKSIIINLVEGKLSPLLLKPEVITETVKDIQHILNRNYSSYQILTSNPTYYYNYAKYVVLRNNTKLYLSLQFPITTHEKLFHTYKIHSFPVEINQNSNHATQLLDLPEYFLITKYNKFYTTLTSNQFDKCQGYNPKHCEFNPLFKSSNFSECAFYIFMNEKSKIKIHCDFKF